MKSLGARIDLRTMIGGLLHPPQIRIIMTFAQTTRMFYYHLRITGIFLEAYKSIRYLPHITSSLKGEGCYQIH